MPAAEADLAPMELGMQQAVLRALEQNLDVALARTEPRRAELSIVLGQSAFDPILYSNLSRFEQESEPLSNFSTVKSGRDQISVGLRGEFDFGMTYDASLAHSDNFQELADARFTQVNDSIFSVLNLTLRQPLLRGFGKKYGRTEVVLAQRNYDISEEQLRQGLLDVVRDVETAYLDLMTARANMEVAEKSLERARDLYELNRTKVEVGTLAPIEITTAEAEVAQREQDLIVAEKAIRDSEDLLQALMNVPADSNEWDREILPTHKALLESVSMDLETAIARALDRRPDVQQRRLDLRNAETRAEAALSQKKHQLDFVADLGSSGNDYTVIPTLIPGEPAIIVPGTRSDSFSEIFDLVNTNWTTGLEWSWAIGNKGPNAEYSQRRIEINQAELSLLKAEQTVRVEVRRAVRAVETDAKRMEAARVNVRLQEKKVEAEQKKYENGMSTSFEVLTFQNDLAAAEFSLISAVSDFNKSLTGLAYVTGSLLEDRGLRLETRSER
jgi:outer membrane protein TolC